MERLDLSYKARISQISNRTQKEVSIFQKSNYTQDTWAMQFQHSKTRGLFQKQCWPTHLWTADLRSQPMNPAGELIWIN